MAPQLPGQEPASAPFASIRVEEAVPMRTVILAADGLTLASG
ncbi:MAG: hypothetical protein ABR500_16165 [Dermatophilaceae bacterium]